MSMSKKRHFINFKSIVVIAAKAVIHILSVFYSYILTQYARGLSPLRREGVYCIRVRGAGFGWQSICYL